MTGFCGNIGWFDNGAKFAVRKDIRDDNATLKIEWQLAAHDQIKDSRALFANMTYDVAPTVTLRGGVRYTRDKVTIDNFYALEGGLPRPGPSGTSADVDAATWWTQTIGNLPVGVTAPRTYFQQGLAPQGLGVVPEFDAQGAYGLGNARLQFESPGKQGYSIGAWVKNFTNRQYLAYALNQKDLDTGGLGFDYALVGELRTYGVDATYRF